MTLLAYINDFLIWVGLVGSFALLLNYLTQKWYKNSVGRILIVVFTIMMLLYSKAVVSITSGQLPSTTPFSVAVNAACAGLAVYGAVSFSSIIGMRRRIKRLEQQKKEEAKNGGSPP